MSAIQFSLIIPVYKNVPNVPYLIPALETLANQVGKDFEVVFVVDGSPDDSHAMLAAAQPSMGFASQLINLSRNFGSFVAIRSGMEHARGEYLAVMAADLQEPPELIAQFFDALKSGACDVVFGQRTGRNDPPVQKFLATRYWNLYRKIVMPDIPEGGVDIFGCNAKVKNAVLSIREPNSSLVAQLFWVGYRRLFIPYQRREREHGKSSWGMRKRLRYMLDSIFSYSDAPILFVLWLGICGLAFSIIAAVITLIGKLAGWIDVPGYTSLALGGLFFGSALLTTQGILGCYLWRAFENTKRRPLVLVDTLQIASPSKVHHG